MTNTKHYPVRKQQNSKQQNDLTQTSIDQNVRTLCFHIKLHEHKNRLISDVTIVKNLSKVTEK